MSQAHELHSVINKWHERVSKTQNAHYEAGGMYEKSFICLGTIVIIASATLGGIDVLVPSGDGPFSAENIKHYSGFISLFIAIVAGLQTFLKLSQRAERHHLAGANYGEVRRSLEEIVIICEVSEAEAMDRLHRIKKEMDSYAIQSPQIPKKILTKYIDLQSSDKESK